MILPILNESESARPAPAGSSINPREERRRQLEKEAKEAEKSFKHREAAHHMCPTCGKDWNSRPPTRHITERDRIAERDRLEQRIERDRIAERARTGVPPRTRLFTATQTN